jgi:RNA polymerase sigma-54 factor
LLQLTRVELEQFVTSQLAENPTLEEGGYETDESDQKSEKTAEDVMAADLSEVNSGLDQIDPKQQKEVDWESLARQKEISSSSNQQTATRKNHSDEAPNYENYVSKEKSLSEHLTDQLSELSFSDEEKAIAEEIIGNINEKGYWDATLEGVAGRLSVTQEAVDDILDTIQRLDPPGVAARDLKECLLNQLRAHGLKNGIVERIIDSQMKELETRNYNQIAKNLNLTLDQVIENVAIIAELDPIPARQFGSGASQYIVPDVYVFKLADEWVTSLNEEGLPRLRVSDFYKEMADSKLGGDDKEYVQDKLKSASWLIKSIQQRQRTIFRVTESIVKRQIDFFEKGIQHLLPMVLKDIAADIEMHESTVSRITNGKYVHTPRGIFELKYFFNSPVSKSDGTDMASESVKSMIKDIVGKEDVKKPLSDQKIVNLLEEKGIELARRTVAKYREQLGILPSSKRKKYF